MLKEVEFLRDLFADDITEAEARTARRLLLGQLRAQFGALPASVVARTEQASPAECEALSLRLLTADSLAELGLLEGGPDVV